jgi:hypothetical protein
MRAGFPTGTHRCRSFDEGHSSLGRGEWTYREREFTSANSELSFEASFGLHLL